MKNSKQQESYKCPLCRDTGWIQNESNGKYTKCECEKQAALIRTLSKTGLSEEGLKKSFKGYEIWNEEVKAMKDTATNYLLSYQKVKNSDNNSLALLGESGAGKTHLLVSLINNFIAREDINIAYMSYIDAITQLKQNVLDKEVYQSKMNRYKNSDLLVIDDLGKGGFTDSDIRIMMEIINHRYLNKLPIMISSEYSLKDLIQIDKALGGRIAERTKNHIFEIKGTENNYRLKN